MTKNSLKINRSGELTLLKGLVVIESFVDRVDRIKTTEAYRVITDTEPEDARCGDADWIESVLGDFQLAQALRAFTTKLNERRMANIE